MDEAHGTVPVNGTIGNGTHEQEDDDDDGHGHGDDDEYDYPEEVQETKKSRKEVKDDVPFNRALPVAELPDDFDGEALDGATFLALSKYVPSA